MAHSIRPWNGLFHSTQTIWNTLLKKGIVKKSLEDIENSELYKYSPYKTLNDEQRKAASEILQMLLDTNNATQHSLIEVRGGAGTGKTILAIYLIKILIDINKHRDVWRYLDDENSLFIKKIASQMNGFSKIGFVIPMVQLRSTIKTIFKSVDGLSENLVFAPEEVVGEYFDLLVVDEAHRLYQRRHLPGQHLYKKFDKINRELMGDTFTGTSEDLTELDWVIKSSRLQIIFYDELQSIRTPDIDIVRFKKICKPHLYKYYELFSQMRCKGGNGYYEYVKKILSDRAVSIRNYRRIENYDLRVCYTLDELFELIVARNESEGLCRVLTGPGWGTNEDIIIQGKTYHWSTKDSDWSNNEVVRTSIVSIHKTQGFDLNYAGVIFGKEVFYDKVTGEFEVNKKELRDNHAKSSGDEEMRQYVINIYLTLMTRGIEGTYVYALDKNLQEYLRKYFG